MIGPKKQLSELVQEVDLLEIMRKVNIPGMSAAYVNGEDIKDISPLEEGFTDSGLKVQPETQFAAASLSKPVFAYLVLRLAADNQINLDATLDTFFEKKGSEEDRNFSKWIKNDELKKLTPRMVLSHRTGLPIVGEEGKIGFQFEPGKYYGYSGVAIGCLQEAITAKTGRNLEDLAKEYVFDYCKMEHSSFRPPKDTDRKLASKDADDELKAANSLHTTATDYARFVLKWMNDKTVQDAFKFDQEFTMKKDPWAVGLQNMSNEDIDLQAIEDDDLERISWGLGLGLQKNPDGSITAFHSGDMNNSRALVAFNITHKTGVVLFTNSKNGLALADEITSKTVHLDQGLNYLFRKYGFERYFKVGWQEREKRRFATIGGTFPPNKPFPEASSSPEPSSPPAPLLRSFSSAGAARPKDAQSTIEQLLNRAESMGLDPQKYLRSEGINIEQDDNLAELKRLQKLGNEMAQDLYLAAVDNIQSRSQLASGQLELVKNPLQTKKSKE